MPAPLFPHWRKSTRSKPDGNCVEVGFSSDAAHTAVRDTKNRGAGHVTATRQQWASFLGSVKSGRLDLS